MQNSDKNNPFSAVTFHEVDAEYAGQRLDNFLIRLLKGVPKSRIYRLLRKGEVRVNKGRVKADTRLTTGDVIRVAPIRVSDSSSQGMPGRQMRVRLNESIIFEDDGLIVIDKPSGMAVHGGSGVSFGVIEGLRADRPEAKFLELVHRLDRDTSGCLMLAKSRAALVNLQKQIQQNHIKKSYQALVKGKWPKGKSTINAPLKKNTLASGERMVKADGEGKRSITRYDILQEFGDLTLVQAKPVTGRTHQIRVHCQHMGHPIIGDEKYGLPEINKQLHKKGLKRLFLHAAELRLVDPSTQISIVVKAPYDQQLADFIHRLQTPN